MLKAIDDWNSAIKGDAEAQLLTAICCNLIEVYCMFDPKPKTTDDLKDIISASLQEISKREKEELVTCYYVKPYSCSGTWFKKLDDAF